MHELLISLRDGVLTLTMNRPEALNSLTPSLVDTMRSEVDRANHDAAIRCIVLTGAGRAFCAGADLKESQQRSTTPRGNVSFIRSVGNLAAMLEASGKPVIAAVNGHAVAGGLELVLACDLVIASASAKIGDGHSNYAMFPGGGATVRLPRRIGLPQAKRLMFSGDILTASEAAAIGLVDEVVAPEDLYPCTLEWARRFSAKSPLVLARMKEALNDSLSQPPDIGYRRERDLNELHSLSSDRREGLTAFREKRTPIFTGT